MRNTSSENLSEHSLDTAVIAHALAVIGNKYFGGNISPERAALLAVYHDASEIITGDMPTPIKYFNSALRQAYSEAETSAAQKLLSMIPQEIREDYIPLFCPSEEERDVWRIVKAADKISALIKCIEERRMGNPDFAKAEAATLNSINNMNMPEADYFIREFLPSYDLTIDEQA